MDREQQRQNRRNTVSGFSCTAGAELTPLQDPEGRPAVACDPAPPAPLPFATEIPPTCPPPLPVPLNLPPGLLIVNDLTTAYCPSTGGYSVTGTTAASVTAGDQQQVVLFTAVSDVTENQLNYLFEVVPSASASIIAAALSGSTNSVVALTHLNYGQSEELIITIQDAKFTVNTLAVEQARNLLICQVESNLQVASCPTSAYFGPSAAVPSNLPYVPSATSTTGAVLVTFALLPSTGGQTAFTLLNIPSLTAAAAQANSIALAQAQSSLRCVFGNAATAAACCASAAPNNNLGFTYCVPAIGPSIPGSATAVGYFSVAANTVFSSVSLVEANSVARELSRNSLNCYFPSTGTTATCVSLGKTGPFASESTTSAYLPPGAVILYGIEDSVTAANAQALFIAEASLNCFWSNAEQTVFCPASPGFTAINNQYYVLDASPTLSISYSSTVPANSVISYSSQADANAQALQLASASVSCLYCSDPIPPTCSGGVNATLGATGDLVCSVLAEVAQNTAISLGSILLSTSDGGANCCYGNEGLTNTNRCTTGAYRDANPLSTFTSADEFYIPPNVITLCASDEVPINIAGFIPYNNLISTDNSDYGCCADITTVCTGTGSVQALPTLFAARTSLFSSSEPGATFYIDSNGNTPYAFSSTAKYLVSKNAPRTYRSITGSTGYTVGIASCGSCTAGLASYYFKGASAGKYALYPNAAADIFCAGPTAQELTLYTTSNNPFGATALFPIAWYSDSCGKFPFRPVSSAGESNHFYAGYINGETGYMITFNEIGNNLTYYNTPYSLSSCPVSRYPYSVNIGGTACTGPFDPNITTLYGTAPAPQLFTASTTSTKFYTEFFNDASVYFYPSASTGYINYTHNTVTYFRPIKGSTASPPLTCESLYPVTVQWSSTASADVCNYPNYNGPDYEGFFNTNIASIWCNVLNPFAVSTTAVFYSTAVSSPSSIFNPRNSATATYYLSKFTPGDTYRSSYREYTASDYFSTLKSYTAEFKASPFNLFVNQPQEYTSSINSVTGTTWLHSATANYMNVQLPQVPNTKILLNPSSNNGCIPLPIYSDIKVPLINFNSNSLAEKTFKTLPVVPSSTDVYSYNTYLLFDGIGYKLSATAQGFFNSSNVTLNDLSRVGAGFTGAIVRSDNVNYIGNFQVSPRPGLTAAIPTYIASIDQTSGVVTLGGYYNKVNETFNNAPLYVTGFKIEAGAWSGSQFTCYGEHCNKLEVGHSLYSYYVSGGVEGTISSAGYVTRIINNTVYYTGAPGYNNFASFDIGTGASHGSGHVYIQGRQVIRLWTDLNKTQPFTYSLGNNTDNFIWSDRGPQNNNGGPNNYTVAKNLILGNTAGSTAEFLVAGINFFGGNVSQRPVLEYLPVAYDNILESYYYNTLTYQCNGSISTSTNPLTHYSHGVVNSCCDLLTPAVGGTAVSACEYYSNYGDASPPSTGGYSSFVDVVNAFGTDVWFDSSSHLTLNGTYRIVEGRAGAPNTFARTAFLNGLQVGTYPCNSTDNTLYTPGTPWMREYLGYWDPENPSAPVPLDCSFPGDCVPVDNPTYWLNSASPDPSIPAGYVFKEFVSSTTAFPGCNPNNFIHVEYALESGFRYSIWTATSDAWLAVNQYYQINEGTQQPLMPFNPSNTACGTPGTFSVSSNALSSESNENPDLIEFSPSDVISPSSYNSPDLFNFSAMPSVGSTASDLQDEANRLAQLIANSFVRCYYFNTGQTALPCPVGNVTVQNGEAAAGEIISNFSLDDANLKGQQLADSRRICLTPDQIGSGGGCGGTKILPASGTAEAGGGPSDYFVGVNLSYAQSGCTFTPTMNVTTSLLMEPLKVTKMTICNSAGVSKEIFVLNFEGDYTEKNLKIPIRFMD